MSTIKLVPLSQIAKQAKVEPKIARARLRRAEDAPKSASKERWEFAQRDVRKVAAIIKAAA